MLNGSGTDPNYLVIDGIANGSGTTLHTFDLSALMTTPPDDGNIITAVWDIEGDDITLVSIQISGSSAETINSTYTLTGGAATAHGSGSGAHQFGLYTNTKNAGSLDLWEAFKTEAVP